MLSVSEDPLLLSLAYDVRVEIGFHVVGNLTELYEAINKEVTGNLLEFNIILGISRGNHKSIYINRCCQYI